MRHVILTLSLLIGQIVYAQSDSMHIEINEIDISANPSMAASTIGSRVSSLRSSVIEASKSLSLSELLNENSVVYIKSYGQGALSTSSFRGTSSSHTGVIWNGININPSMSGSFDFSKIPVFFVDELSLRHGSGGSSAGSGALGGSIYMSNSPDWSGEHIAKTFLEYGSYDTYTAAATVNITRERSLHRVRLYYTSSDNDFRYLNKVFSIEERYENRANSSYKNGAVMQESYFKVAGGTLSSNIWATLGKRELPQPITIANAAKQENEDDSSLKYALRYEKSYGRHYYDVTAGWLYDRMNYQKSYTTSFDDESSRNISHRAIAKGLYQYELKSNLIVGAVASYTFDNVSSDSYSNDGASRNTVLINSFSIWKPSKLIETTAEATLDITDGNPGGLFSIGASSPLVGDRLTLGSSVSYNRRYPSLNDLYWTPGGNPALEPEKGISYDATLSLKQPLGEANIKIDATYYIMDIDDWIVWLPTSSYYWAPQNMKRVVSQGIELMSEANFKTGSYNHRITANYTFSSSQNREAANQYDASVGKQLPYVPKHKFNVRYAGRWRGLSWSYSTYYTSKRYTSTDNSSSTDGYIINDIEASYLIKTKGKFSVTPRVRVNNLFNEYYESIQYYPMPLRSFSVGATMIF